MASLASDALTALSRFICYIMRAEDRFSVSSRIALCLKFCELFIAVIYFLNKLLKPVQCPKLPI